MIQWKPSLVTDHTANDTFRPSCSPESDTYSTRRPL